MKTIFSKKTFSFLAKLALTLGAFAYVFGSIEAAHLDVLWQEQDETFVLLAAGTLFFQLALGAARWRIILHSTAAPEDKFHISYWRAFEIYAISAFSSVWMPGGAMGGDVVRIWLSKACHIPLSLSVHSVVIDRLAALIMLLVMVLVLLPWLGDLAGFDAAPLVVGMLLLAALGLWLVRHLEHMARARFTHIRPVRLAVHLASSIRQFARHRLGVLLVLFYAACAHALFCLAAYVLALSMRLDVSYFQMLVLLLPVILAITLPISVGGWGVREVGFAAMLSLVGVPHAAAVLLSVEIGIITALVYMPAGLLWVMMKQKQQVSHDGK